MVGTSGKEILILLILLLCMLKEDMVRDPRSIQILHLVVGLIIVLKTCACR